MIILGIDPGFARIGYGILKKENGNFLTLDYGCITTSAQEEFPLRLESIEKDILSLVKKYKPDCCAIEDLFFQKNTRTAMTVASAKGVILLAIRKNKLPISQYTPLQVKQAVTGYGKAEKIQVTNMVRSILRIKGPIKLDDTADALAIAICHGSSINYLKRSGVA